ncbi:hypothetical protein N0V91_007475 [Didymella pomorum]|uniref:Uncharacterized protein n=1 Tax=Didymella pomorum TaxID=749634 RepID=A0A9W9D5N1_9PLEO|nr:hypothetical protein N0V91_007475 [Didymella pomorum]
MTVDLNVNYRRWVPPPWLPQQTEAWQTWPGAHLPEGAHPPGTKYAHNDVPQYPGNTTCYRLGERDPYFPTTMREAAALFGLIIVAFLIYIVWPIYVIKHLIKKSVFGDDERFQANHEAYKAKMGGASQAKSEMDEERSEDITDRLRG